MRLELDRNEECALQSAIENYLDGNGMDLEDEDEPVLEGVLDKLKDRW